MEDKEHLIFPAAKGYLFYRPTRKAFYSKWKKKEATRRRYLCGRDITLKIGERILGFDVEGAIFNDPTGRVLSTSEREEVYNELADILFNINIGVSRKEISKAIHNMRRGTYNYRKEKKPQESQE